jgi:hypothetical protein
MKTTVVKTLFNNHVKQHLESPGWQQKGHLIYQEPKNGLLKGVCLNSSGYSAEAFEPKAFVLPVYVQEDYLVLSYGQTLRSPEKRDWWNYDAGSADRIGLELATAINKGAKDFLSKFNDAEDFYDRYKKDIKYTIPHYQAVVWSAVYAGRKDADKQLEKFYAYLARQPEMQYDEIKKIYADTAKLMQAGAEERKALFAGWSEHTLKAVMK